MMKDIIKRPVNSPDNPSNNILSCSPYFFDKYYILVIAIFLNISFVSDLKEF
ncbi:hypothetical protein ES708_24159 [subsurface metagenome]